MSANIGSKNSGHVFRIFAFLLMSFCLMCSGLSKDVHGFSLIRGFEFSGEYHYQNCADLIDDPGSALIWSYQGETETSISYAFHPDFASHFPDPRLKNQVRLAFRTWQEASTTPYGAIDSYFRYTGGCELTASTYADRFGDIRSIVLHEIGHTLGFDHPDYCSSHYEPSRNYGWNPSDWFFSTGEPPMLQDVMYGGIPCNSYRHILSHDDLLAFNVTYGWGLVREGPRSLRFNEVPIAQIVDSSEGDGIVITARNLDGMFDDPNNWADTDVSTPDGQSIVHAEITLNTLKPIGMRFGPARWAFGNPDSSSWVDTITVRTKGTNNPVPISVYRGPFDDYETLPGGPDAKDELFHTWYTPNDDTTSGADFGLVQDVHDWTLEQANAILRSDSGSRVISIPLLFSIYFEATAGTVTPSASSLPSPSSSPGLREETGLPVASAQGLKIIATDTPALVSELAVARVEDLDLGLNDLEEKTLGTLQKMNRLEVIQEFEPIILGGDKGMKEFIILFKGTEQDLPPELLQQGNYLVLNRPDFLKGELFVTVLSQTEDAEVRNFSLLTGLSDACSCEGNFDGDQDQDGTDAAKFKLDFGRSPFFFPCESGNPCNGDFDCDFDCDGTDAARFKEDFGRSPFSNPCPSCPADPWCVYDSCVGYCDQQSPSGCWCDSECVDIGDCCLDACDVCGYCP